MMDEWIVTGRDTQLPPCGLGWAVLGGVWAAAAVVGVAAAVIVEKLTRRWS